MPEGAEAGHPQGHVPVPRGRRRRTRGRAVQLLGCGTILREVIAGGRPAGGGFRRRRRHLELPELHRAAARGAWRRALEPAASDEAPRQSHVETCLAGTRRPGDRGDRLHAAVRRPDPALRAGPLSGAGHRRLRPVRLSRALRALLRGRPALGRGRRPARPGRGGRGAGQVSPRRSPNTASIPTSRPWTAEIAGRACAAAGAAQRRIDARPRAPSKEETDSGIEVKVPDIGDFKDVPIIEVL